MTEQQINRILAEYEGISLPCDYTTDWNEFHRVFRKYVIKGGFLMRFDKLIYLEDTPLQAATELSNLIKNRKG